MLDSVPILQIVICIVSGILVSIFGFLRRPIGFLSLSLLGIAAAYRNSAIGFLLTNSVVFLFAAAIVRVSRDGGRRPGFRWRWCCAAMLGLLAAFLIGRWFQLEARGFSI